MRKAFVRINFILFAGLLLFGAAGCSSSWDTGNPTKKFTLMRFYQEQPPGGPGQQSIATVYRDNPQDISVQTVPFLDERYIAKAEVVGDPHDANGFRIRIQLDGTGKMLLENTTAGSPGRRIAIYSQFGGEETDARWLAAPFFKGRVAQGVLVFTPDATREEADRIVSGLNKVAEKLQKW